jgi:hypothetical protein
MIINQDEELVVPDKTIAFFPIIPSDGIKPLDLKNIDLFLKPLNTNHKRDWFTPHFYKCLPLAIGNMQGFVFSLPYTVTVLWNGGNNVDDVQIEYHEDNIYNEVNFIHLTSEFGHGILTIHFPLTLKTPPGVNLMTISPPNFPVPGLSPMTGVIESDNLRFTFTLNIKMDFPGLKITILPNTPLVGLIPIPRYFCDSFELKNAYDIFDKEVVEEEKRVSQKHLKIRTKNNHEIQVDKTKKYNADKIYYLGKDADNNIFKDHQLPKKQT